MQLPFIKILKNLDDGSSIVEVNGIIKLDEMLGFHMGEYKGKKVLVENLNYESEFKRMENRPVRFHAFAYPNSECIVLLPYFKKSLL